LNRIIGISAVKKYCEDILLLILSGIIRNKKILNQNILTQLF
jgi:hypothetical protein